MFFSLINPNELIQNACLAFLYINIQYIICYEGLIIILFCSQTSMSVPACHVRMEDFASMELQCLRANASKDFQESTAKMVKAKSLLLK